jgi:uncharacterized RDD family membrane protein YckC
MQTVRVRTTQNVFIEYEVASLGDRIVAGLLDWLVYIAYGIAVYYFLERVLDTRNEIVYLIAFIPYALYHPLCEIFLNGQSIGKRVRKIKVARIDGGQPTLGNYLLRWIIRPVDLIPGFYGVGIITISANGKGQRLGDLAAGTTVINLQRRVNLEDTVLPVLDDNYTPLYPQVTQLTDKDVALIREAMDIRERDRSYETAVLMEKLAIKVQILLQVQSSVSHQDFLQQILRDYFFLTGR